MPVPVLQISDFVGRLQLSSSSTERPRTEAFINELFRQSLAEYVGDAAFDEIETLATLPPKYVDLLDGTGFIYDSNFVKFEGLTKALLPIVWCEFVREGGAIHTATGLHQNQNENTAPVNTGIGRLSTTGPLLKARWLSGIRVLNHKARPFIETFAKVARTVTSQTSVSTSIYNLYIDDSKYLEVGDSIQTKFGEFEVTQINGTHIRIAGATAGLDFVGSEVSWRPFPDFPAPLYRPLL